MSRYKFEAAVLSALGEYLQEKDEIHWHDATKEEPPDRLVWVSHYGEVKEGHYNAYRAESKGGEKAKLPNPEFHSQWIIGNSEGWYKIRWWMPIPTPPKDDAP